jgi:predicted Fe-Mo cluster-binding NifX family protein
MKVAFPTNNQTTIAQHIGLAKGFLIIDTEMENRFYVENPIIKKIQQENIKFKSEKEERGLGTGTIIPTLLKEYGVELFVSREFGKKIIENLELEGIKVFIADEKDIDSVLSQLKELPIRQNNTTLNYYGYGRRRSIGRGFGIEKRGGIGFGRGRRRGFRD